MEHPDEGVIHAWLDGALPEEEAAALEAHVADCERCRAAVAEARGFIAASSRIVSALDDVPGDVIPGETWPGATRDVSPGVSPLVNAAGVARAARPWWKQRGIAAAALLVVVAGSAVLTRPSGEGVMRSRDVTMESSDSASSAAPVTVPGNAAGSVAPSELRVAMDEATERDMAERAAAAPRAAMSAPAGRPAVAPAPRATSPVVGMASTARGTVAQGLAGAAVGGGAGGSVSPQSAEVRGESRADARGAGMAAASNAADASLASAAARATVIDTNLARVATTMSAKSTAASTAAAPARQRMAASAPAPTASAPTPPALPGASLAPQFAAAAKPAECYVLTAAPNAPAAAVQAMPRRVRLVDSLAPGEGLYIARPLDGGQPASRLHWRPAGAEGFVLRVISVRDTTQLRIRKSGEGAAEGVATRVGC